MNPIRFLQGMSTNVSQPWIHVQPRHFRGIGISDLENSIRLTANQPLHVRAILPIATNCEDGMKPVTDALSEHKDRLLALHVRAVSGPLVGPFLQAALLTGARRVPALEELDISVLEDVHGGQQIKQSTLPNAVLHDIADAFPALKTLALPGFHDFIPIPSTSTLLTNLTNLRINGAGVRAGSPLYSILRLLHQTPNLKLLSYKTTDQFSYWSCPHEGSWSPTKKDPPVTLPVPLPHLCVADVSASGSGTHVLRCVAAPELQDVHFDGSRIRDGLEDWTEGLVNDVTEAVKELSRRSPKIRRLAFTEMPQHDKVFKWIMTGETSASDSQLGNAKDDVPFSGLEELVVRDGELSRGSVEQLSNKSPSPMSLVHTVGLTNTVLARYVSLPGRVVLKRLGIHSTKNLSGELIVAAAKKAMNVLAESGMSGPFTVEFMENQGPGETYVKDLQALGVKVIWVKEVGEPDTQRDGWWTPDFTVEDASL